MKHSYIIVDDSHETLLKTHAVAMRFPNLSYRGYATNYDDALNAILEHQPDFVFLEINPLNKESQLSLLLINELHRYLVKVPKIIVVSRNQELVFRAMEYGVTDYLVKPLDSNALRKALLKIEKNSAITPAAELPKTTPKPEGELTFADFLRQFQKSTSTQEQTPTKTNVDDIWVHHQEEIIAALNSTNELKTTEEEAQETAEEKITEVKPEQMAAVISEAEMEVETVSEETIDPLEENFNEIIDDSDNNTDEDVSTSEDENTTETELEDESESEVEEITVEENEEEEQAITESEKDENSTEINETDGAQDLTNSDDEATDDTVTIIPAQKIILEQEQPLVICVKSYGDYRYIDSRDIMYFQADNNSTDIHLKDGEMVTAFKTLKLFENVLPKEQFLRIHNSYIININFVSRIHTGNNLCYIKNTSLKLPFSKSYKENVELIIHRIASGNYLEI